MNKSWRKVLRTWMLIAAVALATIAGDDDVCPDGCTCSGDIVSCTGTGQTAIPSDLPNGTRLLYLQDNSIQALQKDCMARLGELEEVELSGNRIKDIYTGAFNGLGELMKLFLEDNHISSLPVGVFAPLVRLTKLRLGGNRFLAISQDLFGSIPTLERLQLNNNEGALTIKNGSFEGLFNLTILALDSNGIMELNRGTFTGLSRLMHLDLSYNDLQYLSKDIFTELSSLLYLKLNSNQRLHKIESNAFDNLLSLLHLNLSDCSLMSLAGDVFHGITELQELHLSANAISDVGNSTFCEVPYILFLDLGTNPLRTLHRDSFRCLHSLRNLNLNHTQLTQIPHGVFRDLHHIVVITLSNSEIVEIGSDAFSNKPRLSRIDIDNNHLESLAVNSFDGTHNLHTLHMHNNSIPSLANGVFSSIAVPLFLTLRDNPLVCDCALDWLVTWILDSGGTLDRCECAQPPALHGLHLDRLTPDKFHCAPSTTDGPTLYNAMDGDTNFTLTCPTYGKPPPTVTWTTPTNEEVSKHSPSDLFQLGENGTLVILKVSVGIAGPFTCEAKNKLGHLKVQVTLDVEPLPINAHWVAPVLAVSMIIGVTVVLYGVKFLLSKRRSGTPWWPNRISFTYTTLAANESIDSI